jgi:hypothetical protein
MRNILQSAACLALSCALAVPLFGAPASDTGAYSVTPSPDNITPTGAAAQGTTEVFGEPRNTVGHPNTIWDQQDINHYKEMLKTSKELQQQYAALKKAMDLRITQPVNVPAPKKDAAGHYRHISDMENKTGDIHNELSLDIANLGTVYVLSGEEKYGDFAKKILLAYADAFPNYSPGNRPGFAHDEGKLFDQRLGDAIWLMQTARGYDLIHDLPSMTPAERTHIENDLLKACALFIAGNHSMIEAPTNWSAIAVASVLITGYATDDPSLVNIATYGLKGTKEKPTGGYYLHFGPECISDDGLWSEGSTGYQFMAMEALVADAEILWHHGIDMYRYRDAALKKLFDSPIRYAYANLETPAISDGGGGSIVGYESNLWEYGYLRYRDPQYFLILNQASKNLNAQFQKFPVSVLYDLTDKEASILPKWKSVNFSSVGIGILRLPEDPAMSQLTFIYGKPHSHGHPDKLSFDLYALGGRFTLDPGSIWYEEPLYKQWYHTTLAHNALVIDEHDQKPADATLITYGPARTMGVERANTNQAYAGVMMDRSLFFTPNYVADIYGAFSDKPHKMDLANHFLGNLKIGLKLEAYVPKAPLANGYNILQNLRYASTDQPWSADIKTKGGTARFFAAPGTPTEILIGDGYYGRDHPPAIIERRETASTVFGNVVDISNDPNNGYVKSITQEGSLEKGYALLTVKTAKGEDLCFTSFRPGTYKIGNLETDAQQAFVLRDGNTVRSMYLAGGTEVKFGNAVLKRRTSGSAYIELTTCGNYLVGNPSSKETIFDVAFRALDKLHSFLLDAHGKRIGDAPLLPVEEIGVLVIKVPPHAQIEFANPGAPSTFDAARAAANERQQENRREKAKAREQATDRSVSRQAYAAAHPVPAQTVVIVQAEDLTAQGNGEAKIVDTKTAAIGKSVMGFDADGQWLEWTAEVPEAGFYNLAVCYCTEIPKISRQITINGEVQEPLAPLALPSTGGWSNGTDDWSIASANNPITEKPLLILLKKGKNTIRLTNTGEGGSNLDYLLITSPDVTPTRAMGAAKPAK